MTAAVAGAVRGRPSVSRLQESLGRARQVNTGLRLTIRVERAEHRDFAVRVLAGAQAIHRAIPAGDVRRIELKSLELAYLADRRIRQLGSVVL